MLQPDAMLATLPDKCYEERSEGEVRGRTSKRHAGRARRRIKLGNRESLEETRGGGKDKRSAFGSCKRPDATIHAGKKREATEGEPRESRRGNDEEPAR